MTLNGPLLLPVLRTSSIGSCHGVQTVEVLELSHFDEVGQCEELLESLKTVLLVVVDIDDAEDVVGHGAMILVVVVIVEDIGQEELSLKTLEDAIFVSVVLVENDLDVLRSLVSALPLFVLKSLLIFVENVGSE